MIFIVFAYISKKISYTAQKCNLLVFRKQNEYSYTKESIRDLCTLIGEKIFLTSR